ncbi:hypothetical protein [Methylocystis sp. SC2]|uniref:hypothetical protein n=1 Tax=Methylocystis sp. (strain SC2) TaxID=187303 RepID=UPI00027AF015|nr:hypothetical protein [Methylocystis sp. SC2]CCJ07061.1 Uncharacterized protein BN69_1610 [Methylocystis sp. SC2]
MLKFIMPLAAVIAVATLAGCNSHRIVDRDDFLAEATRRYKGEDRERIIRAAETVMKHSDPEDVEIRHTAHGFTALRKYFIYAVLAAATGREKWEFTVEEAPGEMVASVSISEAGQGSGGSTFEGQMDNVPLYRLFWKRVDYVLGRRPDWGYCAYAIAEARAAGQNPVGALGGLCGPTSSGADAPPPEQFAPALSKPLTRAPAMAGQ